MSVEALASGFSVSRPAISKHLRVLHDARLVKVTVQGRRHLYELAPEPLGVVDAWLTRVRLSLAARLMELKLSVEESTGDEQ